MLNHALLRRRGSDRHPHAIVHVCFIVVLLFSSALTWREAVVLKRTYEAERQGRVSAIANNLERQFQSSLDKMLFYRRILQYALVNPLESDNSRRAIRLFSQLRRKTSWSLNVNTQRNMPLSGISDHELSAYGLLDRSDWARLQKEVGAALEFSFILQFTEPEKDFERRLWYLSRAGFFVSSFPPSSNQQALDNYRIMAQRSYFTEMTPESNPLRRLRWTQVYQGGLNEGAMVTVSVPVDGEDYWYGVLAMDFASDRVHAYLQQALPSGRQGAVLLLDRAMNTLAASDNFPYKQGHDLSVQERELLRQQTARADKGQLRLGARFVSWRRMNDFDGVLLSIQTWKESIQGEVGRVSLVLLFTWLLFTLLLLVAWYTIHRLIDRLLGLQHQLYQRASHDPLTQLLNRGAFFERARPLSALCERHQQPLALIQLDIDYFKRVNDSWGHHAGDQALRHTARIIEQQLRESDLCGRIGGEEFCLLLPETGHEDACGVAERIRAALAAEKVAIDDRLTLQITASFGVASSSEQGTWTIESLQSAADRRLYLAKQGGRNRVCWQG
ncbi:cellulose biosynthesis regulator diguanylate cyclase DgcQ [Mixta gaviniae]|uniref:cellulose biosynthesis regulator diguanylate cyclase DgcQ n=1 Tax=Mixta gaviniae TaxID=665914 RepID=UPI00142E123E|nr:cellulose biosynthesis regulator diguanylate cyclase DgcQ [Mixta gaviniae]